jgi:alkanesulfonate monooxygenase
MWSEDNGSYEGKHYRLGSTLNVPQALRRPHPPILIGGSGEKKTLRMVAQYAQACNLFGGPDIEHKLNVLRQHCESLGTDYAAIEKTVMFPLDPGSEDANVDELLGQLKGLADLGVSHVHGWVPGVATITPLEILGDRVIPVIADW